MRYVAVVGWLVPFTYSLSEVGVVGVEYGGDYAFVFEAADDEFRLFCLRTSFWSFGLNRGSMRLRHDSGFRLCEVIFMKRSWFKN